MRVSAHVTEKDHQEAIRAFAMSDGTKLALRLKSAQVISVFIFLLTSLAIFSIVLAQASYEGGLALFLNHPVVSILTVVGLLCVPVAAVILWRTGPALRVLQSASVGKIDKACLREGVNLGVAHYDIGSEGLRVDLDFIQCNYPWRIFSGLRETDNLICLLFGNDGVIMVPKRAFDDEQGLVAFRAMFTARTGAAV